MPRSSAAPAKFLTSFEYLAQWEHDRWVAEKRRNGWIAALGTRRSDRNKPLLLHESVRPWKDLPREAQELDRSTIRHIPNHLAAAGYEIVEA